MRKLGLAVVAAAMLGAAPASAASVLDFETYAHDGAFVDLNVETNYATLVPIEGFKIFYHPTGTTVGVRGRDDPYNADPGGATLAAETGLFVLNRDNLELFNVLSVDVSTYLNDVGRGYIWLRGYGNNLVQKDLFVAFDDVAGVRTIDLSSNANFKSLLGFSINIAPGIGPSPGVQFDNLVYENTGVIGAPIGVPEPSTWAMMILGFGAVGVGLRHRRPLRN